MITKLAQEADLAELDQLHESVRPLLLLLRGLLSHEVGLVTLMMHQIL